MVAVTTTTTAPVIDVPSSSEENLIEKFSGTVDYLLTCLGQGQKPWYITSTQIYDVVKSTISVIPKKKEAVEAGLKVICMCVNYVAKMTDNQTLVFTVEGCEVLLEQLDLFVTVVLMKADDEFDAARAKLSDILRELIAVLVKYKEFAVAMIAETVKDVTVVAKAVEVRIRTRTEQVIELASTLTCATACYVLKTAQPYVQAGVVVAEPFVVRAITAGEPYGQACISKAQPYIETVHTKAQENAFVAARIDMYQPYVAKAMETANMVLEEVKIYAVPVVAED